MNELGRKQMQMMLTTVAFSPLFYGILALLLPKVGSMKAGDAARLKDIFLILSLGLIVAAHVGIRWMLRRSAAGRLTQGALRALCVLVAGMGEAICVLGLIVVMLGLDETAYLPFMAIGALFFVDFRFVRMPGLMEHMKEQGGE